MSKRSRFEPLTVTVKIIDSAIFFDFSNKVFCNQSTVIGFFALIFHLSGEDGKEDFLCLELTQ